MSFEFPKKYKEFKLTETGFPILENGIWNEYQNGKYLISIQGSKRRGFKIIYTKNISKAEEEAIPLELLSKCKTIEEAWKLTKEWIDKNSLRSEL